MLKILMITESLIKGGKERRLIELLRFFENQDIDIRVTLVLLKDILQYPEIHTFSKVKLVILKFRIRKDPMIFFRLVRINRDFKPDIIHSWGSMPSVYCFAIAKINGIPFLNAMIADAFNKDRIRAKITFPFSDLILSNSYAGLKAYHAPLKKGRVIYNGFNLDRLKNLDHPEKILLKYGIKTKFIVGMIGAFHPRKDYATFLAGAQRICERNSNVTFLAVGDGSSRSHFEEMYRSFPNIVFTGNVDQVESIINIMDVGVLLSNPKVHSEGISNSILEMMAFSKIVIATRGGGTDEIIEDGKTGILISPHNVDEFADKLALVLNNGDDFLQMRINARQKILEDFSIETMGLKTLKIYDELMKSKLTMGSRTPYHTVSK